MYSNDEIYLLKQAEPIIEKVIADTKMLYMDTLSTLTETPEDYERQKQICGTLRAMNDFKLNMDKKFNEKYAELSMVEEPGNDVQELMELLKDNSTDKITLK